MSSMVTFAINGFTGGDAEFNLDWSEPGSSSFHPSLRSLGQGESKFCFTILGLPHPADSAVHEGFPVTRDFISSLLTSFDRLCFLSRP
jgi:hypothetical protein